MRRPPATIQSVDRALRLLERLSENPSGKRLLQLANETRLPASTVHRALQTLFQAGYVCQDPVTGAYRLTGKLLEIASYAVAGRTLREEAIPHLRKLRDKTRESAHLVVLDGVYALTVESVISTERNLVDSYVGERVPLHCTAVGKVLLASLPLDKLEDVLLHLELTRFTENTICTVSALRDHLKAVREMGYALDWEENEIGIRCIAAPVRNAVGEVVAAIGISGPATRIREDTRGEIINSVVEVAADLSCSIGYPGNPAKTLGK